MKKQKRIVLLGSLVVVGGLAACGKTVEGPTTTIIAPVEVVDLPIEKKVEILYENEAFRVTHVDVKDGGETVTVKGYARVYEATVGYSVEDGHTIFDKGVVTASVAAPEWGDFEFTVTVEKEKMHHVKDYIVVLFEESAKDGSAQHELPIPVPMEK